MPDEFDAFNEQVETEPEMDGETNTREETGDGPHETQVSDVAVVGNDNDRLRVSAETSDGTQVDQELDADEAGRAMSLLGVSDARELDGQPVLVWEDEDGSSRLEFETTI